MIKNPFYESFGKTFVRQLLYVLQAITVRDRACNLKGHPILLWHLSLAWRVSSPRRGVICTSVVEIVVKVIALSVAVFSGMFNALVLIFIRVCFDF